MIKHKSPSKTLPGYIELPDLDDFSGAMFNRYKDEIQKQGNAEAKFTYELNSRVAYAGAHVIKEWGKWAIDGLTVDEFLSWEKDPAKEKTRFVAWLGSTWAAYYKQATDPNG